MSTDKINKERPGTDNLGGRGGCGVMLQQGKGMMMKFNTGVTEAGID